MGVIDFWRTWSPLVCLGITTMVPSPAYPPDDVTTWDTSDLQQMSRLPHTSRGLLSWCHIYVWLGLVLIKSAFFKTAINTYLIKYLSVSASIIMAKLHGVVFYPTNCISQHQLISRKCALQMNHQSGPDKLLLLLDPASGVAPSTATRWRSRMLQHTINTFL